MLFLVHYEEKILLCNFISFFFSFYQLKKTALSLFARIAPIELPVQSLPSSTMSCSLLSLEHIERIYCFDLQSGASCTRICNVLYLRRYGAAAPSSLLTSAKARWIGGKKMMKRTRSFSLFFFFLIILYDYVYMCQRAAAVKGHIHSSI